MKQQTIDQLSLMRGGFAGWLLRFDPAELADRESELADLARDAGVMVRIAVQILAIAAEELQRDATERAAAGDLLKRALGDVQAVAGLLDVGELSLLAGAGAGEAPGRAADVGRDASPAPSATTTTPAAPTPHGGGSGSAVQPTPPAPSPPSRPAPHEASCPQCMRTAELQLAARPPYYQCPNGHRWKP